MKIDEIKKPIILMCVAALLIAVLIIIAGVTYSISSRSASPLFQCVKAQQESSREKGKVFFPLQNLEEAFKFCVYYGVIN